MSRRSLGGILLLLIVVALVLAERESGSDPKRDGSKKEAKPRAGAGSEARVSGADGVGGPAGDRDGSGRSKVGSGPNERAQAARGLGESLVEEKLDKKGQKSAEDVQKDQAVQEQRRREAVQEQQVEEREEERRKAKADELLMEAFEQGEADWEEGKAQEALALWERAAAAGNDVAMVRLAEAYHMGLGVEVDLVRAAAYYKDAADLGNARGQRGYAFFLDTGHGVAMDRAKALLYYTFAAKNFDPEAAHVLAYKYLHGINVQKSCALAATHYRTVAAKALGSKPLRKQLNTLRVTEYLETGDLKGQEEELVDYHEYSAEQGDAAAQSTMGQILLRGMHGQEVDVERARDFLEQAAAQGNPVALANLGLMYETGTGVEASNETAREYYIEAAEKGNSMALNNLGAMYLSGKGVEKSYSTALYYFKRAANLNNPEAQVNLGTLHYHGLGVDKSYETARQYYTLAANQENTLGQYHVAKMHHHGIGWPDSCTTAVKLYKEVAEKGEWAADLVLAMDLYGEYAASSAFPLSLGSRPGPPTGGLSQALVLFERLAHRGYEVAQHNAATLYHSHAVPLAFTRHPSAASGAEPAAGERDPAEEQRQVRALFYFQRAAEQGNSDAHLRLGDYFYDGLAGVRVDHERAAAYYRYASDMRNAEATFNLGLMHQEGLGLPRDLHLAKRYYDLALTDNPDAYLAVSLALAYLLVLYAADAAAAYSWGEPSTVYGFQWDSVVIALLCVALVALFRRRV